MRLKKTKVDLHTSEHKIFELLKEFDSKCESCEVLKHKKDCEYMCRARYVYENTLKIMKN